MRMTQAEVDAFLKRRGVANASVSKLPLPVAAAKADTPPPDWKATAPRTEVAYDGILQSHGYDVILHEPMRFILGRKCSYTPDFLTIADGCIWFHEVKGGFTYDDAKVKFKVAAKMYPFFGWVLAVQSKKVWTRLDLRTNRPIDINQILNTYGLE